MTTPVYPLFVSVAGFPLNFRLVCPKSSMKTDYMSKIKIHGGILQKSPGKRIILIGGSLPCERGHFKCEAHLQFSMEPAFKISWVDDCLAVGELLDIKGYLLNPSPAFARIDFTENINDGMYKLPVPSVIPEPIQDDYDKVELNIPCGGDRNQVLESDAIIMAAAQRALNLPTAMHALSAESTLSSQDSRTQGSPVAASRKSQNQDPSRIDREPHEPLRILGDAQASSTPLCPPVESARQRSLITGGVTSTSGSDMSASSADNKMPNEKQEPKRSTHQRERNLAVSDLQTSRIAVAQNAIPGTSRSQTGIQKRPTTQSKPHSSREIPTTFTSSSSSDSETSPPAAKRATAARKVQRQHDSSDSDQEFGPPPGAVVRLKGVRQNTREPYTNKEEMAIVSYIKASKKFIGIKSDVIWKKMDGKPGLEKRSWHSLKTHFLKFMLPQLEKYNVFTEEQLSKLRSTEHQSKGRRS